MSTASATPLLRAVVLLAAALAISTGAIALRHDPDAVATWWPATGLFIGVLVLSPRRWWPALLVAVTAVAVLSQHVAGRPLDLGLGLALANAAEALVAATLLRRWQGDAPAHLEDPVDYFRLLLAALAGAVTMGVVAALTVSLAGGPAWVTARTVAPSHLSGALVVLPLLLLPRSGAPRGRRPELVLQVALLAACFVLPWTLEESLAALLLPLPMLVWAALRLGPYVAALEVAVVAAGAVVMTRLGYGPIGALTEQALRTGDSLSGSPALVTGANVQLLVLCTALLVLPAALTSRQRALLVAHLDAERDLVATTLASTSVVIVVTDGHGVVTQVNDALQRLTGFGAEQVLGRPLWELALIPPDRRALVREMFADAGGELVPEVREADVLDSSGERLRVVWHNNVVRDGSGRLVKVVCTATDITSERVSHQLVEHLFASPKAAPMLSLAPDFTVTLCNRAGGLLLGLESENVVGRPVTELMCPQERGAFLEALDHAARESSDRRAAASLPHDWTWRRPDGREVMLTATVSSVLDAVGRKVGYLLVARDVTEVRASQDALMRTLETERQAVERLRRLDAVKNEFVSTASHELRTPTTSIVGYAELLRDGEAGELTDQQLELVEVISRNGERLLAVANDLLTLAGLETHDRSTWHEEEVDLTRVVSQAGDAVAALTAGRRLDVDLDVPAGPVPVRGDATHLDRVLLNLLSNAVKFTPDGGRVTCRLRQRGAEAVIEVRDTGIGIPEDEQAELFTKFFRSTTSQDLAIPGTGLGLSIIHRVVSEHGGRITVTSARGEGATFTVTLPLAAPVLSVG